MLIPHLDQYRILSIEPGALELLADQARPGQLAEHLAQQRGRSTRREVDRQRSGRIEMLVVSGPLTKYGSSLSPAPSLLDLRRTLRDLGEDKSVDGIMLVIDSPGGGVPGVDDAAQDVAAVAKRKPLFAYAEDLLASASYWLISGASRIVANRSARVGSLGTFAVVRDLSRMAEREGVRVHVISTGGVKGAGVPGTEITEEQLAEARREVEAVNDLFVESVAAGRGLSVEATRELFDGRVHIAAEARRLKLIDEVSTLAEAVQDLRRRVSGPEAPEPEPVAARSEPLSLADAEDAWQTMLRAHDGDAEAAKRNHVDLYARILEARRAARGARSSSLN